MEENTQHSSLASRGTYTGTNTPSLHTYTHIQAIKKYLEVDTWISIVAHAQRQQT